MNWMKKLFKYKRNSRKTLSLIRQCMHVKKSLKKYLKLVCIFGVCLTLFADVNIN